MAVKSRQAIAGAGEAEVEFERPGQVEAHGEQQPAHSCDERGRLELEAPSRRHAGRAQGQQKAAEGGESDEDAERIAQCVGPDDAAGVAGEPRYADRLHREDREHAGHQIEDQAAEKGEGERGDDAGIGGGRRRGALRRLRRRSSRGGRRAPSDGRRGDGQKAFAPGPVFQDDDSGQALAGVEVCPGLSASDSLPSA